MYLVEFSVEFGSSRLFSILDPGNPKGFVLDSEGSPYQLRINESEGFTLGEGEPVPEDDEKLKELLEDDFTVVCLVG